MSPKEFREARKRLGLSQKALGKALKMGRWSHQTLSAWEADDRGPPVPGPVIVAVEYMLRDKELADKS